MDLAFGAASDLAGALRRKEVGSRELLDHYLSRVERLNPKINAVVELDVDRARAAAAAADEALARGDAVGSLHGLPMTIKNSIETEGIRTTSGAPELAEHVPTADAPTVARLKSAGAIVFGKTNLPLYAGDIQSYNEVHGTTNNPWDLERIPGGSSGGAAAALAAGLTSFELGSDIGGSIRNPAHFCGVFGHKPTWGIVPGLGHIPGPPGQLSDTDVGVLGPMGRSTSDLQLGLDVLAGPDERRSVGWRLELPPARRSSLAEYRMAAWLEDPDGAVDPAVGDLLAAAVDALRGEGAKVDEARPEVSFRAAAHLFERLVFSITTASVPETVYDVCAQIAAAPVADDEPFMTRGARAIALRYRDWMGLNEERSRQQAAWDRFFRDHDVLLCPITPVAAFPHDHTGGVFDRTITYAGQERPYVELLHWAGVIGVVHLPAAVVPVGRTADGLPVGIQIVGPYLEDRTVLDVAARIEAVVGGFEAPPGFE